VLLRTSRPEPSGTDEEPDLPPVPGREPASEGESSPAPPGPVTISYPARILPHPAKAPRHTANSRSARCRMTCHPGGFGGRRRHAALLLQTYPLIGRAMVWGMAQRAQPQPDPAAIQVAELATTDLSPCPGFPETRHPASRGTVVWNPLPPVHPRRRLRGEGRRQQTCHLVWVTVPFRTSRPGPIRHRRGTRRPAGPGPRTRLRGGFRETCHPVGGRSRRMYAVLPAVGVTRGRAVDGTGWPRVPGSRLRVPVRGLPTRTAHGMVTAPKAR